jgi:hypothetical protein
MDVQTDRELKLTMDGQEVVLFEKNFQPKQVEPPKKKRKARAPKIGHEEITVGRITIPELGLNPGVYPNPPYGIFMPATPQIMPYQFPALPIVIPDTTAIPRNDQNVGWPTGMPVTVPVQRDVAGEYEWVNPEMTKNTADVPPDNQWFNTGILGIGAIALIGGLMGKFFK